MPNPYKADLSDVPDVDPRPNTFDEKHLWFNGYYRGDTWSNRAINNDSQEEPSKEPAEE